MHSVLVALGIEPHRDLRGEALGAADRQPVDERHDADPGLGGATSLRPPIRFTY
jgi:hypothetical protein